LEFASGREKVFDHSAKPINEKFSTWELGNLDKPGTGILLAGSTRIMFKN
jgi:hypothetical protein